MLIMKKLPFPPALYVKTYVSLSLNRPPSSYLTLALYGKIPNSFRRKPNSFRRNTTRSVLVSLALLSLSCAPAHAATAEFTREGSIISQVTNPTGGGNHNIEIIRDGDKPPVGNQDSSRQWDSYTGNTTATSDWIGYQYTGAKSFNKIIFQEGKHFGDGGWLTGLSVQVRKNGTWNTVSGLNISPTYPGTNNNVTFESYTLTFPNTGGDAIRIYGAPGGSHRFISVGELQVFGDAPTPTPTPTPTLTPGTPSFTQAQFEAAIAYDIEGEHGKLPYDLQAPSIGYPCGVPSNYGWKFSAGLLENIASAVQGRGQQLAGAAYNQIYNACPGGTLGGRKVIPNARILTTDMVVSYFSISQQKWVTVIKQPTTGAAFAEDFVNNEATGADFRDEASGYKSVRSGINNAQPVTNNGPGSGRGRFVQDGSQVGYNFHGFGNRFGINWADVKAIVLSQSMRCFANSGSDLTDCNKLGYLGQVGLDSWASTTSGYDGFRTHGGVSGGRFKPVTTSWQVFTNYSGPRKFVGVGAPPVPQF